MSAGAGGLTLIRSADARAVREATTRATAAHDTSALAWELAARARFDRSLARAHEAIATLAFDVAEGVIGRAVTVDATTLDALISQAITRARTARRFLVCVHPDDVTAARQSAAQALSDGGAVEWLEVAGDPSVARGCVGVETERGRVFADWAESLAVARARWLTVRPESHE